LSEQTSKKHSINFDFISIFEEGSLNVGYVPDAANSKSGVTIAIGFDLDLDARNVRDLKSLKLSTSLVDLLSPFWVRKLHTI
jgi:hypothetical protein